eukprot:306279_1
MPPSSQCTNPSVLGTGVSITFGTIYGVILLSVSLYSYRFLMKYNSKFSSASRFKKLKSWIMDVYKRRRCYLPIITHLGDMVTDIAVIVQFGEIASVTNKKDCGVNMYWLLGLSIFALIFYRTLSAFLIYQSTKSLTRAIVQWLDFELFRALYINYLCDKTEPCSPQRWITSLEAVFEATPQALIQTIFLVKSGSFENNQIVVVSLVFSLWSIVSKIVSDDRIMSISEAKYAAYKWRQSTNCRCVSWSFIARYIWRVFDVSSRIFISSLFWLVLGGTYLSIAVVCDCIVILIICAISGRFEFLFGIVAIVISKSSSTTIRLSKALVIYRFVMNLLMISTITFLLYTNDTIKCWRCSEYDERKGYKSVESETFILLIYCWMCLVITPILYLYLTSNVFVGTKSNSRTIQAMIDTQDWQGIIEMQAYKGDYGPYNADTSENLLMLAIHENYGKLVEYLVFVSRVDLEQKTNDGKTILDYIKMSADSESANPVLTKKYHGKLLMKIYNDHSKMTTKRNNGNVALIAAFMGYLDIFKVLANSNKVDVANAWQFAIDGDQAEMVPYMLQHNNINVPHYAHNIDNFMQEMINRSNINILRSLFTQASLTESDLWFYTVKNGNLEAVQFVRENYVTDVSVRNSKGRTVLHEIIRTRDKDERPDKSDITDYLTTIVDRNIQDGVRGWTADQYRENSDNVFDVHRKYRFRQTLRKTGTSRIVEASDKYNLEGLSITGLVGFRVKIRSKETAMSSALYAQEADVLYRIDHEGVVDVIDCVEDEANSYIITASYAGQKVLDKDCGVGNSAIIRDLLRTLQYLHGQNIVHRNLNIDNLNLISNRLVLIDFETAKVVNDNEKYNHLNKESRSYYSAPEEIATSSKKTLTGRILKCADIWSVGIIAYILVIGHLPFDEYSQIVKAQISFPEDKVEHLTDDFIDFVSDILVKNPLERMTIEEALDHPWLCRSSQIDEDEKVTTHDQTRSLKLFNYESKIKQVVSDILASGIRNEPQSEVMQHFIRLDADGDGFLDVEELTFLFEDMGYCRSHAAKKAKSAVDSGEQHGDGIIDFDEFKQLWYRLGLNTIDMYIHKIFNVFDENGEGTILLLDFANVFSDIFDWIEDHMEGGFDVHDSNTIEIDFDEFRLMIHEYEIETFEAKLKKYAGIAN